ncbi:MAG: MarR family transcriptional regulator, organic hydroperoxide resistance regulator [Solirubrobacteraceae bacterium]|nr:MarR family transcriptional regulator, organic hydroperoxide resistance regulator [Solirubrobacteraceae bacterium]
MPHRGRSQASAPAHVSAVDGVAWATDLIRLEIALWDRVDARLRESHQLPLAFFESLYAISRTRGESPRVGDLARALRVTVGGTSKLVDRIERAGLMTREPDPGDRRASRVVLTKAGKRKLTAAVTTYEAEVGSILGGVLRPDEQQRMRDYVSRLLISIDLGEET